MIEMYGTITNKSYAFQVISFVTISSAFFHKLPTSHINWLNRQNNGGNQIVLSPQNIWSYTRSS